ncbi:MAG: hypothetical protein BGO51_01665 [Rhodospirillales bacterium 69-11]|mgnify:CR=1 FL=1|nr:hypothetical protein [Rhodospirillales bacterium]MBN8929198.1 hypothetical protein [Rhodospirillales bacterium]OJW25317.1 MAG: hypothetical protein BGO51_01665 [Rhodospirillales bacterium 69-11]
MPPTTIGDETLAHLLAEAGLSLTDAQRQELKTVVQGLAAMKARVRQPRGPLAELAHGFAPKPEDAA